MENFDGIFSLFIACVEIVLIINLLIFSEKNFVNKIFILTIFVLFLYQFWEFLICFAGLDNSIFIYAAITTITFLPPLVLFSVLNLYEFKSKANLLIFIPALFFTGYYFIYMNQLEATKCAVMYAAYYYPLGDLYGVFYYLPVLISIIIIIKKIRSPLDKTKKEQSVILLTGFLLTFVPSTILYFVYPNYTEIVESVLCKFAFILALTFFYFVLKNKTSIPK
ncbi:MAG: hypothetical protein HND52_06610 [Ignavibacteriae bacterium]|nr:hypothetical protein [Ignavibacteriota bacterium]NOG97613.1 hypothetical protein [Ignavibacteriota bacterium]